MGEEGDTFSKKEKEKIFCWFSISYHKIAQKIKIGSLLSSEKITSNPRMDEHSLCTEFGTSFNACGFSLTMIPTSCVLFFDKLYMHLKITIHCWFFFNKKNRQIFKF